ncbi:cyclic nucleotide-binding domain-containing protein [Jeotgalibacillus sp. S-D1]|uniref:cyclic nucleotide-binding domain-containing protein n=1 Tax=Jeotgalibacillus sp. S-D1 TaxID=2552189 RepID=UPI00105A733E|nr:cyclic nucleotide-binding domain-containing protein [Jeotgalibacillus sp. S-D1]TDL31919.1 cyclic nucleotide-binding domain-containing protein [Jeotgalibacillus sp. S-D1]
MKRIDDKDKIEAFLSQHGLHAIFSKEAVTQAALYHFTQGEMLCSRGEVIQTMYFLVKGKVKIFTTSPEGKTLIVRFKTPLAVLGDIEYVKKTPVFNTVEAVSDGYMIGIPFNVLRKMGENQVELLTFLVETITQKFYTESQATSFNMLYPVEVRLASYLLSLSSDGEGSMFHEEMRTASLTEVADVIGTSYRHLNRVILKLCGEGMIRRENGSLIITDLNRLRERADGNIYE